MNRFFGSWRDKTKSQPEQSRLNVKSWILKSLWIFVILSRPPAVRSRWKLITFHRYLISWGKQDSILIWVMLSLCNSSREEKVFLKTIFFCSDPKEHFNQYFFVSIEKGKGGKKASGKAISCSTYLKNDSSCAATEKKKETHQQNGTRSKYCINAKHRYRSERLPNLYVYIFFSAFSLCLMQDAK